MAIIKHRRGTAAEWTSANPILAAGEEGVELDTGKFKIGNGSLQWSTLPYFVSETSVNAKDDAILEAHESAGDPHAQYLSDTEVNSKITTHESEGDPHTQYLQSAVVAQDEAPADTSVVWLDTNATPFTSAPEIHATQHASGGSDPVTLAQSQITGLTAAIAALAPSASPVLTGNPTAPTPVAGDNDTSIATTAWAAERATVGNLMTANQASGTDVTGDVSGTFYKNGSAPISSSTDWASHGTRSVKVVGDGVSMPDITPTNAPWASVIPGQVYTFTVTVMTPNSGKTAYISVYWLMDGANTSYTYMDGSRQVPANVPTKLEITAVAPPGAYGLATYWVTFINGGNGEVLYADDWGIWAGAGGDWAMPGVPITNLGTRITRPNIDDRLVEQWNPNKVGGAGWSVVDYDSGVRGRAWTLDPDYEDFTSGALRRQGNLVTFDALLHRTSGVVVDSEALLTLPVGFRPSCSIYAASAGFGQMVTLDPNGIVVAVGGGPVYVYLHLVFDTTNAIPSTLPGTLVSAASA